MKKILLKQATIFALLVSSAANAREVYNSIDNRIDHTKNETGWNFYKDVNTTNEQRKITITPPKKDPIALLQAILNENKKQTKIQKKILKILKNQFDPEPEIITLPNGEKCVANSSEKCYKMPITAEAKKIPVLVSFMKDPGNIEKAAKYIQWQARHFREAYKGGASMHFASLQYADKAYPLGVYGTGFTGSNGASKGLIKAKIQKDKLLRYKTKYKIVLYVGLNPDMDMLAFPKYMDLFKRSIPKGNYKVIFVDKDSMELWKKLAKKFNSYNEFFTKSVLPYSEINSDIFKEYKIYTSPTLSVLFNKNGDTETPVESRIVAVGNGSDNGFESAIVSMLKLQGVIPNDKDAGYRNWLKFSDEGAKELKNIYGIEIDNNFVERLKRKQRKRENIFDSEDKNQGVSSEK